MSEQALPVTHVSRLQFEIEGGDDGYLLEVAIIGRVPLFDPARWKAIVSTVWWNRGARRLRRRLVEWVIALALRLGLVRRTGGLRARSLLMGICLGSLVEVVHVGHVGEERKSKRKMKRR